jgi:hypothetical protein
MDCEKKYYFVIISMLIFLVIFTVVEAQEFIVLANDRGVQKNSFTRGEGIEILITLPYSANVEVWLHNPPGTAGPSPTLFIPSTLIPANIQTVLGPKWLDEKAPCGKYRLEIRVLNPPPPLQPKTEYRFFDYAMNEPPCTPTTITTTTTQGDITLLIIVVGVSAIAIAAIVTVLLLSRWRAPPPKERVVTPPPIPPTPAPPSAPPKAPHKRTPIVRGSEREEE